MGRRQFISLIIVLSILWLNMSCQSTVSKEDNFIQFVVQPKLEKGKAASLSIFFKEKPDAGSLQIAKQGDELFATLDAAVIAANIESDGPYFKYQTSIPVDANGNFNLPILEAKIKGKKYYSPAYSVEVLDTVSAGQHPIRMLLQTDKEVYQLKDTINLTLSAYSKFFDVHYTSDAKLVAQGAPSSVFEIADEGHVDYMTGIPGFKAYVDQHFDVVRFVWNAGDHGKTMESLDHEPYIKTQVFSIILLAKQSGDFTIPASQFVFHANSNADDFKERLLTNQSTAQQPNKYKFDVRSNTLQFKVQ